MQLKSIFSKLFQILVLALILAFLINYVGCDDAGIITEENFETQTSAAKYSSESQKTAAYANSCILQVLNGITSFSSTCPVVTVDTASRYITVDYGSSCVAAADSIKRSGSYRIDYYVSPASDSAAGNITFNNFRIYRVTSSTGEYITITGSTLVGAKKIDAAHFNCVFVMNNTFTSNDNTTRNVNITLNALANLDLIGNFLDDSYSIYGSGTLTDKNSNTYNYTVTENEALAVLMNCRYPIGGKTSLAKDNNTYIINFYPFSGGCDGVIEITKGNLTKAFNIDGFEF